MPNEKQPIILIFDDEKPVRQSIRNFLEDCNYTVLEAENGRVGLEIFEREKPDLLLIDLRMPEVDGFEVLWKVVERSPETPAIVVSGAGDINDVIEALHLGAWDYLHKPIEDISVLRHTVEKALDRARLIRENYIYQERLEHELIKKGEDIERTNKELHRRTRALRKSEERFRTFMETSSDLMHITDKDGTFIYVNEAMAGTLEYPKEELIGMNIKQVLSEKILETTFKPESKELFLSGEISPENIWVSKHGKEICGEIKISAIYDKAGTFTGTRGIFRDLTHQKKAEEEKEKLQTQLQQAQKLEAVGTLAGGIAHDFNNLLMGIQGRVSLMLIDTESSGHHFEHLKGIETHVHSASDLTRQLLGFARGGKYEVKTCDLNELIKEQNRMFGRTNKGITIRGKYEKDLWPVDVDQGQIQQVILNLYVNAAQAMPNGGALNIRTEKSILDEGDPKPLEVKPGRYIKISITDTGSGMDEDTMGRIFDPFFTTKEMGRGTGLGLASVYGIIKNHGGFITVYSEKGIGTTFNVYLPASDRNIREEDKPSREVLKGKGTVLLVDDEEMIIDVAGEMIENFGYHVMTAASGKEAVDVYKKNRDKIDMVILDMIMPEMSGEDAYDNLKEIDPGIKVLLSSGYSIEGRAAKILDRGCDGFIQKPFDMKRLSNKIVEVLDRG